MMIETRMLHQVVILAEARSYAKAAKMLHLSQPALSRSIQQLESKIGQRLFDRNGRQIQLTETGLLFVNRARELLARGDDMEREVSLLDATRGGQLTIGAGPYASELIVKPVLKTLLSGRPDFRIQVGINNWLNLVQLLRLGEFSLVIAELSELTGEPDLEIRPLTPQQGYFLVRTAHPLLKSPKTTVKDVLKFPLAMASNLPARVLGPLLRDSSIKPHLALITDNLDIIREVISGTDIIGVFALSQVEAELKKRKLAVIPCIVDWLHSQYGLITLKRHTGSPDEEAFIHLALEVDGKIKRKEKELAQKYLG